ncbi:glycoside hydrolase family 43 protein [Mycena vitilis]|nr:glycoside hydrolase family 43 protein [Mycena vitilis]
MKFSTICSLLALAASAVAYPNPLNTNTAVVRDPSIWYNSALGTYFVFSTDNNVGIFTATTLAGPWTNVGSVLPSCSSIQLDGRCDPWAPDVNYINGLYTVYYAISTGGSQTSAIGVATSPSMQPGTWTDLGQVISSTPADVFNAIDPNIIDDPVGLQLAFGSYWEGIYQVGLYPGVNNLASSLPGTHLAGGDHTPTEGGFVYKPTSQSYYYFFFSYGISPSVGAARPASGTEYRVLVGRGAAGQGPFYDANGNELTTLLTPPAGTVVLASHDNIFGPGGQSVYLDPVSGRDMMVYHYIPTNAAAGGPTYLGINYLDFSSGWPVVVS